MKTTHPITHIVDDDEAIRDALAWQFSTRGLAAQCWASGEALLDAVQPAWRGCIVLDIRMRGISGLQCFDALKRAGIHLPVIFITGHGDVPMAVQAMRDGAFHFVEKPFSDNRLIEIVQQALAHDERTHAERSAASAHAELLAQLSPREREVIQQLISGKANKQIADELGIAVRTVEAHRARIYDKLHVRSALELMHRLGGPAAR